MSDYNENPESPEAKDEPVQKKKLTDMQLRYAQIAAGIVCAAAMVLSLLFVSVLFSDVDKNSSGGSLISFLWVIVFLAITFGRRSIENKYRLRLNLFGLLLLDGIAGGILIYFIIMPFTIDQTIKLIIIIGGTLLLLGLGVLMPYLRYRKRVENGTLPPIRLPEKTEDENSEIAQNEGRTTRDDKIAEMMREIEERENKGEK